MRCAAYKVAPEDGPIQSETCTTSNETIKSNHKNFVHLVGLYTCCKMMHGTYNVKVTELHAAQPLLRRPVYSKENIRLIPSISLNLRNIKPINTHVYSM